jgi:MFS family permease
VEYFGRVGQGERKKALEIPRFVFYNEKKRGGSFLKRIICFLLVALLCVSLAACAMSDGYGKYANIYRLLDAGDYAGAHAAIDALAGISSTTAPVTDPTAATAPADQRGIAMGTYYLGLDFGSALGPIIGGFLYGNVDLRLFYPMLCVFAIGCVGMYFICRKI